MDQTQRAEYLVETYADAILRLSYTYLKSTHDAQDVCQTVFVKLLTEPREFESPEHERAYILRMAANAAAMTRARPTGQRRRTSRWADLTARSARAAFCSGVKRRLSRACWYSYCPCIVHSSQ